jgi:integrator complex subunit 8
MAELDNTYFEFLWEMPLLELLTHLHASSGNKARVATLLALVQRPALCVHNPQSVQAAAVAALKQRFLQRLSAQVLGGHDGNVYSRLWG